MKSNVILALDQGTTSSKALLIDATGIVGASGSGPLSISSPQPGWVEQDATEIWPSVVTAIQVALAGCRGVDILGVAISNQRETVVAWNGQDGRPVGPAISWQDQRGDAFCKTIATPQNSDLVRQLSGRELGSMFPASKVAWFLERYGDHRDLRVGSGETWLIDRLTGGTVYATEAGNASRTLLFDIETQSWSPALGELFHVDTRRLAVIRPSTGPWGTTVATPGISDGTPILAVLGDSHAALYGHWALAPGHGSVGKATYGTGSSVMVPTARETKRIDGIPASSRRAVFVPALNGLGAPWWESAAVGTITGLDSATTRAEIARAGIESVAHQICDVVEALDPTGSQPALHAGGGATTSQILMQTQADLLGRTLLVSRIADISALGAGALAFKAAKVEFTPDVTLAPSEVHPNATFTPEARSASRDAWRDALWRAGVDLPARTTDPPTETHEELISHD